MSFLAEVQYVAAVDICILVFSFCIIEFILVKSKLPATSYNTAFTF